MTHWLFISPFLFPQNLSKDAPKVQTACSACHSELWHVWRLRRLCPGAWTWR